MSLLVVLEAVASEAKMTLSIGVGVEVKQV